MPMPKVTETRTQDDFIDREATTPLNLGNYPHDLEQHAKQTDQLGDLKINYTCSTRSLFNRVMNYIDCTQSTVSSGYVSQSQRPLDRISHLHLTPAQIIE